MMRFIEDLIDFISYEINKDKNFPKTKVCPAYRAFDRLTPPQIVVYALDDREDTARQTYEGEVLTIVPIQITVYAETMKIGGKQVSSYEAPLIYAEKLKKILTKIKLVEWNSNIVRIARQSGGNTPLPVSKGATTYMAVLRYEFTISTDYQNIN